MASTRTTADKLLLDVVEPGVEKAFYEEVVGFDLATKSKKDWRGRKHIFDVQMNTGGGVRPTLNESATLPEPGAPTHVNGEVTYKSLYGVLELTHDLIESSRGDKAAFADALSNNLESTLMRLKKQANFQFYSDGRGILSTVATGGSLAKEAASELQVTVDNTQWVEEGDMVALWTSNSGTSTVLANGGQSYTDGTYDSESVRVKSVDSATTLTLIRDRLAAGDSTVATSNVLRLYAAAHYNVGSLLYNSMMGIGGFTDYTNVVTLEGLSRSTYTKWKGYRVAATAMAEGATLNRNHFYKMSAGIKRQGGKQIDQFMMDDSLVREFLAISDSDVRFAPVTDHDPGYSTIGITVGGKVIPIICDMDCPKGYLFGFPKSSLEYWEMTPLQLDDSNGSVIKQPKPYGASGSGDIYYAYFRMKGNFATKRAWDFGTITALSYSAETA